MEAPQSPPDGGDVDDLAAALFDHGRDHRLGHDKRPVEVDVDDLPEVLGGHLHHGDALDDAGVVHQNIDHAHLGLNFGHQLVYRVLAGNIAHVAVGGKCLLLCRPPGPCPPAPA